MKIFIRKVRFFLFLIELGLNFTKLMALLIPISIFFLFYQLFDILKYGIITGLLFYSHLYPYVAIICYSFFYYFIVCYYIKLRFKSFNKKLSMTSIRDVYFKYKTVKGLIEEHNIICDQIKLHNQFWQKYYFTITYTLTPFNLILLQQILFGDILLLPFILSSSFLVGSLFSHFMLNYIIASINKEAKNSYKFLHIFYLKINFILNLQNKLKVFIFFD